MIMPSEQYMRVSLESISTLPLWVQRDMHEGLPNVMQTLGTLLADQCPRVPNLVIAARVWVRPENSDPLTHIVTNRELVSRLRLWGVQPWSHPPTSTGSSRYAKRFCAR